MLWRGLVGALWIWLRIWEQKMEQWLQLKLFSGMMLTAIDMFYHLEINELRHGGDCLESRAQLGG